MRRAAAAVLSALLLSALLAFGAAEPAGGPPQERGSAAGAEAGAGPADGAAPGEAAADASEGGGEDLTVLPLRASFNEAIAAADGEEAGDTANTDNKINVIETMAETGEETREAAPEPPEAAMPDPAGGDAALPADAESASTESAEESAETDFCRQTSEEEGAGAAEPGAPADEEDTSPDHAAAPDGRAEPGENGLREEAPAAAEGAPDVRPVGGESCFEEKAAPPEPAEQAPEPGAQAFELRARMEPLALLPLPGGCRLLEEPRLWLEAENLSDGPLRLRVMPDLSGETAALYRALGAEPFGEPVFLTLAAGERLGMWLTMPLREGALCALDPRAVDGSRLAFELRASAEAARP